MVATEHQRKRSEPCCAVNAGAVGQQRHVKVLWPSVSGMFNISQTSQELNQRCVGAFGQPVGPRMVRGCDAVTDSKVAEHSVDEFIRELGAAIAQDLLRCPGQTR